MIILQAEFSDFINHTDDKMLCLFLFLRLLTQCLSKYDDPFLVNLPIMLHLDHLLLYLIQPLHDLAQAAVRGAFLVAETAILAERVRFVVRIEGVLKTAHSLRVVIFALKHY